MDDIVAWCDETKGRNSHRKTNVLWLSLNNRIVPTAVHIGNELIKWVERLRFLGEIFDRSM